MRYLLAAWQAAMLVALWGSANPGYATLTKKAPTAAQHWVVTERGSLEFYSADVDNWKAYTCCRYDLRGWAVNSFGCLPYTTKTKRPI